MMLTRNYKEPKIQKALLFHWLPTNHVKQYLGEKIVNLVNLF